MVKAYLNQASFKEQRQSKASERVITRELLNPERNSWVNKPASEIDAADIAKPIATIRDRPAPSQVLGFIPENQKNMAFRRIPWRTCA
jgi:hypothetical protein